MPTFTSVELVWTCTSSIEDTAGKIDIVVDGVEVPLIWYDGDHWHVNPSDSLLDRLGVSHLGANRQGIDKRPADIEALIGAILSYPAEKLRNLRS